MEYCSVYYKWLNIIIILFGIHASSCALTCNDISSQMWSQQLTNNPTIHSIPHQQNQVLSYIFSRSRSHFTRIYVTIHSFQSRDWLEDLEGKTSMELQRKSVNVPSISKPQIFRLPLKKNKKNNQRYVGKKASFGHFP